MKHKLFFGEIEIGEVIQEDEHVPYLWGKLTLSNAFKTSSDPLVKKLQNYIDCSMLFEKSDDWNIVYGRTGYRSSILTPSFLPNNKISLRLAPPQKVN